MAVDTRNKRASALGIGLAALVVLPVPDATVAQADRQHVAFCYAGISAEELEPPRVLADVSRTGVTRRRVTGTAAAVVRVTGTAEPVLRVTGTAEIL